ncbi:MAG: discoidin domain-containing protein [Clostridiales bacterium]|nr:discoidin domain-containing protein [Clostridiales bacterium]
MKKLNRRISLALVLMTCIAASGQADEKTLLFIPDSHLDTQWNWDVVTTIDEYLKNTLNENIALLDKYPNFRFNFEGAIRYKWMKEYYPSQYARLQAYIDSGRWNVSGCSVDANDVMVSSAESIMRNWLYGSVFFKNEFGVRGGHDIMLPDCFGFSYALPSLAAHCGMTGFHSQKLSWGSAIYDRLPPFGIWQGVDGSQIYAVYKPHAYDAHEEYNKDMANDAGMERIISDNLSKYGCPAEVRYVGPRSDHGGGLHDRANSDGENTPYWLNYSVASRGPVKVKLSTPDEVFEFLAKHRNDKYMVHDDELPMRIHGVGSYTSQAVLKRWNRRNELLADAAEKASVAARWLGVADYPAEELRTAWMNNLWQAHHDGITGTSIPKAYIWSQNEYALANKTFGDAFVNAAGAMIAALDTRVEGIPIVLYNPLSFVRTDVAEAQIECASRPDDVKVVGPDGQEVLTQVAGYDAASGIATIAFAATVPSLGYAVYDVRPGEKCTLTSNLTLDKEARQIVNGNYRYSIDKKGDCNIYDLVNKRLLMGYPSMVMLDDTSNSWPAWEITYSTVTGTPVATVDENVDIQVAEDGPLRKSFRVTRSKNGSSFIHYIMVNALNDRVDMVNEVDWNTRNTLLKLNLSLRSGVSEATYDLSLGTIKRGVRTSDLYEVQGHQWADMATSYGDGVSVINDCKYGWDMPQAGTLRLSLIHTPRATNYSHQQLQDLGDHHFTVAFFPHRGQWGAATQQQAAMVNQPLMAFVAPKHEGTMGKSFSFASLNTDEVAVKALKKAELSDEYIVRVYELTGKDHNDVRVEFPAAITSVREVNGLEEELPEASSVVTDGSTMAFAIGRYQPKTFAVTLASPAGQVETSLPSSTPVALDYDTDMMSGHDAIKDVTTGIAKAFPAELLSDQLMVGDISFNIGSRAKGARNALSCHGQTITLDRSEGSKLYILALSTEKEGSEAPFKLGDETVDLKVPYYGGFVGQAKTAFNFGAEYRRDEVAFTATHCHDVAKGADVTFSYIYIYVYCLTLPEGVDEITLPDSKGLYLIAATLSDNDHDDVRVASDVYTYPQAEYFSNKVDFTTGRLIPDNISANAYTNSNEKPALANDGEIGTKWCSTAANSWIEYSFRNEVVVNRWAMLNAAIESTDMITRDFNVQYYDNGSWKNISTVTANSDNYLSVTVNPVTARRFRLQVKAGEQNGGNTARIYEFALFGHAKDEAGVDNVYMAVTDHAIQLHGITPNPSNGAGSVSYSVPAGSTHLALEIYDMSGRQLQRVALPDNGGNGGDYTQSISLTPGKGLYLYRITGARAGSVIQSATKRLLIL